ncbi:MAG: hypothetical protein RIQ47_494 [Bacteroidota bacterium]
MKPIVLFILFTSLCRAQSPCREVIGYYAGWQWYDRNHLMSPQTVPYQKYSVLTYAFMQPQANGTILISDPWGDKNQLLGPINWSVAPAGYDTQYDFGNPAYHLPGQKLSDYAHQSGCKLLASIGGWTYSANFPTIAASPSYRAAFAHDCNTMVLTYGLDGIDIDWEYPSTLTEKQNYTLLLQQVRDSLDAIANLVNRPLQLSIATGASPTHMMYVDWLNVIPLLDRVNLMSYDFYGTWSPITNHNAPLFPVASGAQSGFSCAEAVTNLLNQGVPPSIINMGVAWYGRSQLTSGNPGLQVPGTGMADMIHFGADDGTPLYYNIVNVLNQFDYHWDTVSRVPYLTGISSNSFVSFDDETSIEQKAQYINAQQLRGAIIWEISGDFIESTTVPGTLAATPLLDKLNATFCSGSVGVEEVQDFQFTVFPQPAKDILNVRWNDNVEYPEEIIIWNMFGEKVIQRSAEKPTVDCSGLPGGMYLLQLNAKGERRVKKFIKE